MTAIGRCFPDAAKFNRLEWVHEQTNLSGKSIRQKRALIGQILLLP